MFPSTIASRLLRLGLLSVFCAGLFLSSGEVHVGSTGNVSLENRGIHAVVAADPATSAPAGADAKTDKKEPVDETINSIISFFNLGIGVLTFLITPLIMLAGWLLSPDWTFGEIFWLRPILHQLWVLVSNVVYVIFGFFLIVIAFANIFGSGSDKAYEMKTMLPKLVTGMLMVPFTWFIVSAVLSVSNVLTASVIQLPISTILKSGGSTGGLLTNKIIPKNITYDKNGTSTEPANSDFHSSKCPDECLSIEEFLTNGKWGAYNLLSVYAYGIFKIQEYKSITLPQGINKIIDVASKLWFWVIFFIVFGILVIAIVYALFSRAVMLWLYAMFSPLFALNYVMDFKGSLKDSVGKLSVTKFLSLAMVPVYVSAALAFGLMFLGLVMGATGQKAGDSGILESSNVKIETKVDGKSNMTTFQFWEMTFVTKGLLDAENKAWLSTALDIGKGIIGTIIMNVLALVILWMAVMAALGADDVTKAAVEPIQKFGGSVGDLMMKAPQYIPIPLWWKDKDGNQKTLSMAGMANIWEGMQSKISNMAKNGATDMGQSFGEAIGSALWLHVSDAVKVLSKIDAAAGNANYSKTDPKTKGEQVQKVINSWWVDFDTIMKNPQIKTRIVQEIQKAYNLEDKDVAGLLSASDKAQFDLEFQKLAKSKGNGLDQLVDGAGWVNGKDVLSSVFTKSSTTPETPTSTTPPAQVSAFVANTGTPNVWKVPVQVANNNISIDAKDGKIADLQDAKAKLKAAGLTDDGDIESTLRQIEGKLTPPTPPKP